MSARRRNWATIVPSEIWLDVFNYATWVPGALDLSDLSAINTFTREDAYTRRDVFHSTMQVNLATSLVCKAWHSLAQEFMFRYILIESGDQAQQLARLLDDFDSNAHYNNTYYTPCRWTRRLEVSMRSWSPSWTRPHTAALLSIRRHCTNLAIFSTAFCNAQSCNFCVSVGYILRDICADSNLRRLELKDSQITDPSLFDILGSSLEILYVGHSRTTSPTLKTLALRLPKLQTLITGFAVSSSRMIEWDMPSLQALSMDDESGLKSFLARVGRHLRFLVLHNPYLLAASLLRCPDLHQVDIDFHDIQAGGPEHPFVTQLKVDTMEHTSLRCIILRNLVLPSSHGSAILQHRISSILYHISGGTTFPALECVRFVPSLHIPATQLQFRAILRSWIRSCSGSGIQVQHSHQEYDCTVWQPLIVDCKGDPDSVRSFVTPFSVLVHRTYYSITCQFFVILTISVLMGVVIALAFYSIWWSSTDRILWVQ